MRHYTSIIQNNLTNLHNHVNSKISHACKSKVTSHGNVTSYETAKSRGNSVSRLVEILQLVSCFISMANFGISHAKYLILPCMSTHVCRHEVIIELYHTCFLTFYCNLYLFFKFISTYCLFTFCCIACHKCHTYLLCIVICNTLIPQIKGIHKPYTFLPGLHLNVHWCTSGCTPRKSCV